MKKGFLDTNVLLDFWLVRLPGFEQAEQILQAAQKKQISLFSSSSAMLTAMYFLGKAGFSKEKVSSAADVLLDILTLLSPTEKSFRFALYAGFNELEDAVQYYTALQVPRLDAFITRNTKDFKKATSRLPVLTPKEFLAL